MVLAGGGRLAAPDLPLRTVGRAAEPEPPLRTGGRVTAPELPVRTGGREEALVPPLRTGGRIVAAEPPLRAAGGRVTPAPPLLTVGGGAIPDPPFRTDGGVDPPDPPLRTVDGLAPTAPPLCTAGRPPLDPPAPETVPEDAPPPPPLLTFVEGRVTVVPVFGGDADPAVGRVCTTGRPVLPEGGGVTMGRPGEVGLVTPDRGSVLGRPGGASVRPVPRPDPRADPGGTVRMEPPPEAVGRRPEFPSTPGIAVPGALPPDRFGVEAFAPEEEAPSLGWARRFTAPATPGWDGGGVSRTTT